MFERKPLRTDVGAEILARTVDGRLAPGSRINEVHLAADLGISRTPLREALLGLLADGALESVMGRGFRVPPLGATEIAEVLTTLALLEPAALRGSAAFEARAVMELQNTLARARIGKADTKSQVERLYVISRTALEPTENGRLRALALKLNRLTLRYLHTALDRGWDCGPWLAEWDRIVEALRRGDRESAAAMLADARREQSRRFAEIFTTTAG
jgi:DNA-binding GntR family transcriptional regulator